MPVAGSQMPGAKDKRAGVLEGGILGHVTKLFRVCDDKELNPWGDCDYIESASVAHGEVLSHRASVLGCRRGHNKSRAILLG